MSPNYKQVDLLQVFVLSVVLRLPIQSSSILTFFKLSRLKVLTSLEKQVTKMQSSEHLKLNDKIELHVTSDYL